MEETITTAELAKRLAISPSAISRRVKAGELQPVTKLPGVRGAFLFRATEGDDDDES
jgi:hypothetical protein